jgi:hypothetical protein
MKEPPHNHVQKYSNLKNSDQYPVKRTQNTSKITNYITGIQDRLMLSPNTIATKIAETPTKNKPEWNPEVDLTEKIMNQKI